MEYYSIVYHNHGKLLLFEKISNLRDWDILFDIRCSSHRIFSHHHRVGVTVLLISISAESSTLILETRVKPGGARYIFIIVLHTRTHHKSLVSY